MRADDRRFSDTIKAVEEYRTLLYYAASACAPVTIDLSAIGQIANAPPPLEAYVKLSALVTYDDFHRHHLPSKLTDDMKKLVNGEIRETMVEAVAVMTSGDFQTASPPLQDAFKKCSREMFRLRDVFAAEYRKLVGHHPRTDSRNGAT